MTSLREKGCTWDYARIPESCLGVDIVIGIDEAGRGPVLGSLVYTAAFWPVSEDETIKAMGFDDSKQLREGERDRLLQQIMEHPSIGWVIEELDAVKISEEMLRACPTSLNAISYDAVIRCLKTISNVKPIAPTVTTIFIDTVGDPETYKNRLTSELGNSFGNFVIEKKADAKYKTVSAASIIAKVTRDRILREWKWEEKGLVLDKQFGSGYPGDEHAVHWLDRGYHPIFGYPNLVRFSWSTVREVLDKKKAVVVKWDCEEEDDVVGSSSLSMFFNKAGATESDTENILTRKRQRSSYFMKRKLKRVSYDEL